MKTDALFYELFQFDPKSLFELVNLKIEGEYTFESITVKTTEKRFDGFFRCTDKESPHVFLEVQGYDDPQIYWRLFREICTFYEQRNDKRPFIAVLLLLDEKYNTENFAFSCVPPYSFICQNLSDCLKNLGEKPSPLTVLKPLLAPAKTDLTKAVSNWKQNIDSLQVPDSKNKFLIELLEHAILQRFPKLTLKEIEKMIQLTPLEKTVAGQELIQLGLEKGMLQGLEKGLAKGKIEGKIEGREQGEVIGKILLAQKILKCKAFSKKSLAKKSLKELKAIFKQLEAKL